MATSPSFNWPEPDNTDLVKNGALAIRTAVDAIDTSMTDLLGGTTGQVLSKASNTDMDFTWVAQDDSNAIQNAIVDAKGDLIAATAADTPARLAVGTDGQVLTADSTAATGLAWATPTSGGMTLINTGGTTLSGTTVTISSIPATYKHLFIVASNFYTATGDAETELRFNADSGFKYTWNRIRNLGGTVAGASSLTTTQLQINTRTITTNTTGRLAASSVWIYNYTDTTPNKFIDWKSSGYGLSDVPQFLTGQGNFNSTSAISSVSIINTSTFSGGKIYVYGVN